VRCCPSCVPADSRMSSLQRKKAGRTGSSHSNGVSSVSWKSMRGSTRRCSLRTVAYQALPPLLWRRLPRSPVRPLLPRQSLPEPPPLTQGRRVDAPPVAGANKDWWGPEPTTMGVARAANEAGAGTKLTRLTNGTHRQMITANKIYYHIPSIKHEMEPVHPSNQTAL
jgi:hypothetical protein